MNFTIPSYPDLQYGSVYCIGRNYVEHIHEMKSEKTTDPVVFLKPRSSIIHDGGTITIPEKSNNVHHEIELVILVGEKISNISAEHAASAIRGFGVGIDVTARDIQSDAKSKGLPWSLAKGFDTFAPVGNLLPFEDSVDLQNLKLRLKVNGEVRQDDSTTKMIFPVDELISYLSHNFTLYPGDLIFTGTPKGVSKLSSGDQVEAILDDNLSTLAVHVE